MNLAIQGILSLLSAAIPTATQLIAVIKDAQGNVTVGMLVNGADVDYDKTIAAGQAWLAAHPKTIAPGAAS
jgi:hypothetical protein